MVLTHSRFHQELLAVIREIEQSTHHPYAKQFAQYPEIDLFLLHFNYLFLKSQNSSAEMCEVYCVCQLLMQLGLDSHDYVSVDELEDEQEIKSRQLTILSGDYFYSYYYYYLAQKNQIQLVHTFAQVIKEVNECKTKYHARLPFLTTRDQKDLIKEAKCKMMGAVLDLFEAEPVWYVVYEMFVEMNIQRELGDIHESDHEMMSQLLAKLEELDIDTQNELRLWLDKVEKEQLV